MPSVKGTRGDLGALLIALARLGKRGDPLHFSP